MVLPVPGGVHSHMGTAFKTWRDFSREIEQARATKEALSRLIQAQEKTFATRFSVLERDLGRLDTELKATVARNPSKPLLASHPIYQYLARRYSLNLRKRHSVEWPRVASQEGPQFLGTGL